MKVILTGKVVNTIQEFNEKYDKTIFSPKDLIKLNPMLNKNDLVEVLSDLIRLKIISFVVRIYNSQNELEYKDYTDITKLPINKDISFKDNKLSIDVNSHVEILYKIEG